LLRAIGALLAVTIAVSARIGLCAYAYAVANFDASHNFGADTDSYTHDLIPDTARIFCGILWRCQ
jgi:hypothetical protein